MYHFRNAFHVVSTVTVAATLLVMAACSERSMEAPAAGPTSIAHRPQAGSPAGGVLKSSACSHTIPQQYLGDIAADCVEIWGTTLTLNVTPPGTGTPVQFGCIGWGHNVMFNESDKVPDNHAWYPHVNHLSWGTTQVVDSSDYIFQVTPKRPTVVGDPTIQVYCDIDPASTDGQNHVNIMISGPAPTLTAIIDSASLYILRKPQTSQVRAHYTDSYNGHDLLTPVPATTYSITATPAGSMTISSTGLVTAVSAGSATVHADSGSIHGNILTFTSLGCSSVAVAPITPITFHNSTAVTLTATPTCDVGVNATTEPIVWSTASSSVATVAMTGGAHHTGIVSPVAPGTTTVKACDQTVTGPPCSATVSITVPTPSVDIAGPAAISVKGTYTYLLSRIDFLTPPSVAWTERFCTGSITCSTPWTSLAASGDTARRTLTPNCAGTGENYYEISVLASAGGAETATAQHNTRLCPVPP